MCRCLSIRPVRECLPHGAQQQGVVVFRDFEVHHKIYYPELLIDLPFDRSSIVQSALSYARSLGFKQETALDAVWLFDRIVACGEFTTQYVQEKLSIIVCVCVLSIGTATEKPAAATGLQDQGFGLEVGMHACMMGQVISAMVCAF